MWQIDLPSVTLTFSAAALDMVTLIGSTQQRALTVKNVGNGTINVSNIAASGGFTISSNDCPALLGAGASCNLVVSYSASGVGSASGTLTVTDDAAGSPHTVQLTGSGVDIAVNLQRPGRPKRSGFNSATVVAAAGRATVQISLNGSDEALSALGEVSAGMECVATKGTLCRLTMDGTALAGHAPPTVTVELAAISPRSRRLAGAAASLHSGVYTALLNVTMGGAKRSIPVQFEIP